MKIDEDHVEVSITEEVVLVLFGLLLASTLVLYLTVYGA